MSYRISQFLKPENHNKYHIFGLFVAIFRKIHFFVFSECIFHFLRSPIGQPVKIQNLLVFHYFLRKTPFSKSTEIKAKLLIFIYVLYYLTVVRNLHFDCRFSSR